MEQLIRFEQFYYTNYGQGMRFEGDSTHDKQVEKDIELFADNWMRLDVQKPVETVAYNIRLGCYVAAMVRPCTKEGDARVSYWIHAVMPKDFSGDGFRECLSWPLSKYQQEVVQGAELNAVSEPVRSWPLMETCKRYGLTGTRLMKLIYMVWQTVCGQEKPSTLYFILDKDSLDDYNAAARNMMALVYELLPEPLRQQADYQAYAVEDIRNSRFVFKAASESGWCFYLDAEQDKDELEIPEEERELMGLLARLYEADGREYAKVIRGMYHDGSETFEDFVWNYYLQCMKQGEDVTLSQETLIRCLPRLEQQAQASTDYRRLLCRCLNSIDTSEKQTGFVQVVMEKYILAAAGLTQTDCREYDESFERIWKLLDQLRAGSTSMIQSYLEWIRKISPVYYQYFVKAGLSENRTCLLRLLGSADVHTPAELFRWMEDSAFLKNVIAYREFVADKAEEFYFLESTTDEERQALIGYCRDRRKIELQELSMMPYEELMELNSESMDYETQNLWLKTVAARIQEDAGCVSSVQQAEKLCEYLFGLKSVQDQLAAELAKQKKNTKNIPVSVRQVDADSMTVIVNAIWQFENELDILPRYNLCVFAKYTSHADFKLMTDTFWAGIEADDYVKLYKSSSVHVLFRGSHNQQYLNYRLYWCYKKKKEEKFNFYKGKLTARANQAIDAIWMDWTEHPEADSQWMYTVMLRLMEEDDLQVLLKDYARRGTMEARRVAEFLGEDSVMDDLQTESGTEDEIGQESLHETKHMRLSEDKLSWIVTAGIGLLMGLIVNGWYMAVHLSKILEQPMLVWGGIAGIAVVIAILMAFADKLVRTDMKVSALQIPWAGLWLFINLVLTYFIGNKITAVLSAVLLLAAYIWLRLKKLL